MEETETDDRLAHAIMDRTLEQGLSTKCAVTRPATPAMNEPFRILVLFGNVPLLGQERSNINVMEALQGAGAEVLFLIRREWTGDTVQAELTRRGLAWQAVPYFDTIRRGQNVRVWLGNIRGVIGGSWELLRWHRRFRPTHIHAASPENILNFLPALALLRTPLVYRAGDIPALHHWLWRLVWRCTIRRTTQFASNSRYVENTLIANGVPPEKIARVANIAPLRHERAADEAASLPEARRDLCTFVYVGQLTRQKGVDVLVEAAIDRCLASPTCRFFLAGDYSWQNALVGELRSRIDGLALSERIVFLGYVKAIRGLLEVADVHVCPSVEREAFGNVVVEAKQVGRPSLIFPTGGLTELVEHGVDGYVCPEKSVAALERALAVYEYSPGMAREQGAAARRSLDRLGGGRTFCEEWVAVYECAAGRAMRGSTATGSRARRPPADADSRASW